MRQLRIQWKKVLGVVLSGFILSACTGGDSSPRSCDFNEKLVAVAIDEQTELLTDPDALASEILKLEKRLRKKEEQREESHELILEAGTSEDDPQLDVKLSKSGNITAARLDILRSLQLADNEEEKKYWKQLYIELQWSKEIQERAYLQRCAKPTKVLKSSEPYQSPKIEKHFIRSGIQEEQDLYYPYARSWWLDEVQDTQQVYRFLGQKTGRGFSTGFFVENVNTQQRWKVKVGWEAYRETLATHLSWALGFYIDEVFHVRSLKVQYHEDLATLFEGKGRNIAHSLSAIVLEDGTEVSLVASDEESDVAALFKEHESRIAAYVFKSVILELRDPNVVRVGQWSYDALGHYNLRSVRMMGLMNFWLGNDDVKFDNNRLFLRCSITPVENMSCLEGGGEYQYQFVVHDLGLSFKDHPNKFNEPDTTSALALSTDDAGERYLDIKTRGRDVFAWYQITEEDLLVFADRLAALTEKHFQQALAASGYPYPALVLMSEKLKARRNEFLEFAAPGRYELLEVDLEASSNSSGLVDIGDEVMMFIPQDGFVLEEGELTNNISLGKYGQHAEMLRK